MGHSRPLWLATALIAALFLGVGLWPGVGAQGSQAPPTPHGIEGRQDCLACHRAGTPLAMPQDHTGRPVAACLACHPVSVPATPPAPTPTATPHPSPTPTPTPLPAATPPPPEPCLACHGTPGLTKALPSGEVLQLYVDGQAFETSVHGGRLFCSDCHRQYETFPHPPRQVSTRREYTLTLYEVCRRCHFANYTRTLDSIHYQLLSLGDQRTPVCIDCHGSHEVMPPEKPRANISRTCSRCHPAIYEEYISSVHGRALVGENNLDVPVCTDCHGAHIIRDPRTAAFHLATPELCTKCHSDPVLMGRYGLSTRVTQTYLRDFHGATISLRSGAKEGAPFLEAVCTDCHGVHDITRTDDPSSPVMRANLLNTCRKCHPGATENFPAAWLSHYEPGLDKAPLVYIVRLFYLVFIPFVLLGLSLHVLLDLWKSIFFGRR